MSKFYKTKEVEELLKINMNDNRTELNKLIDKIMNYEF